MKNKIFLIAVFLILAMSFSTLYASPNTLTGQGIAYEIERSINIIIDYTQTTCIPAAGDKSGSFAFIIIADQPILSLEAPKKKWLIIVTAAVGQVIHDNPSVVIEKFFVSDVSMMKSNKAYLMDGNYAHSLQQQVKNDQITIDQMYSSIETSLKEIDISQFRK